MMRQRVFLSCVFLLVLACEQNLATSKPGDALGNTAQALLRAPQRDGNGNCDRHPLLLMFVPKNYTYWSEYVVMRAALEALCYQVDVRSSSSGLAHAYMVGDVASDVGGQYPAFVERFEQQFGQPWNAALNPPQSDIAVNGSIATVSDMSQYEALIIVGGSGALAYRYDGSYAALAHPADAARQVSAGEVLLGAEHLNRLAIDALSRGKPVLAECHGATLMGFFRGDGAAQPLLASRVATGFPDDGSPSGTAAVFASVGATYRGNDTVIVESPNPQSFPGAASATSLVLTSRDWHPSTVSQAARTLANVLDTYPYVIGNSPGPIRVLLMHGGALNASNCSVSNQSNDVPCNHTWRTDLPAEDRLPADYTHLRALLLDDSPNDTFVLDVTDVNMLAGQLPYNANDQASVLNYLSGFDVVLQFKHWGSGMTAAVQAALSTYAQTGGGIVALHHGLYNDGGKNTFTALFGAQATNGGWSVYYNPYTLISVSGGHFVTQYGITWPQAQSALASGPSGIPRSVTFSAGAYPGFTFTDEIYETMGYSSPVNFGRGLNQIIPLLTNDRTSAAGQLFTSGFVRQVGSAGNAGRLVYLQPGERRANYHVTQPYGQMIRNAVVYASGWSAAGQSSCGDADGDSVCDAQDGCPDNASKTAPGQCGCAVADTDSDGDGTADCLETPPTVLFSDTFDSSASLASYTETPPSERTALTVASGLLQLVPAANQAWYAAGNGPALFLPAQLSGDFVIATQVNPHLVGDVNARPTAAYNVCGLLARSLADPLDWVFAASGRGSSANIYAETKTTTNGATTIHEFTAPAWQGELRICRIGSTFRTYRRMNGDTGFVELTPVFSRSDLAGTLEVGLAANGYTASPNVQCDYNWVRLASISSLAGCTAELAPQ
jgi:putative intracellular protease/amidase